jgi:hypothetical protein
MIEKTDEWADELSDGKDDIPTTKNKTKVKKPIKRGKAE